MTATVGWLGTEYSCLVLPDHITAFVLLNPTMILINDLARRVHQHSFALEESAERRVRHARPRNSFSESHIQSPVIVAGIMQGGCCISFTCVFDKQAEC